MCVCVCVCELVCVYKKEPNFIGGQARPFYHIMFMYIAPASDCSLLTLNLPIKVILRRFELFSDVWDKNNALFKKIRENSFKSTNTIIWL